MKPLLAVPTEYLHVAIARSVNQLGKDNGLATNDNGLPSSQSPFWQNDDEICVLCGAGFATKVQKHGPRSCLRRWSTVS